MGLHERLASLEVTVPQGDVVVPHLERCIACHRRRLLTIEWLGQQIGLEGDEDVAHTSVRRCCCLTFFPLAVIRICRWGGIPALFEIHDRKASGLESD
jgi:hypothetical protein